jgi:hypothetical protein
MTGRRITPAVGVLIGDSPIDTKATAIADTYRKCPYCVSYASAGRTVVGLFSVPPDHRWWLQWVADDPEGTLGLQRAEVFFAQAVEALSPWSRGEVKPSLERAPCAADCPDCPRYRHQCAGCPATRHYLVDW